MGWGEPNHPHRWRCPRCGETGDPRTCTCMHQLANRLIETRRHLRAGRTTLALAELGHGMHLLELLGLDAVKARR